MQRYFVYILFIAALTSCTKSQFVSVRSNAVSQPDRQFVFENDSFKINYTFREHNGILTVAVYNKLASPLYVDWQKCSIIIAKKGNPMWKDESIFEGSSSGTQAGTNSGTASVSTTTTSGTMTRSDSKSFIPPQSYATRSTAPFITNILKLPPKNAGSKADIATGSTPIVATRFTFEKDTSPFSFRTFLTLSYDDAGQHPIYVEQEFWVNEIIAANTQAKNYTLGNNEFSLSSATGAGKVLGVTALIAALAIIYGGIHSN